MKLTGLILACAVLIGCCGCQKKEAASPTKPLETGAPKPSEPNPAKSEKLGITDVKVGTGLEAKPGDTVYVQYRGTLSANGTEFDSTMGTEKPPFMFMIGQGAVIRGWDQGVPGMKVGGERKLHVPSTLGYGSNGQGKIPANADLDFDIKLLYVIKPGQENVIDTKDLKPGSGERTVRDGDQITIDYVGKLLNGKVFDSTFARKKPYTFTVGKGEVISGIDEGVKGMKVGGERKITMPPFVAYGTAEQGTAVPPNSALMFDVTVRAIK